MIKSGFRPALKFRDDPLGQYFTQLHAPLVERIDVPDSPLRKDTVLVERDKLSQALRREPFGYDRIRWPIPFEGTMRHKPIRCALSFKFLGRFTER